MSTFGERLSILRTNKKLSQAELSTRLNIAKSTLSMYETDKREPNFETLQKIADFFDVSVDYLLGRGQMLTKEDVSKELQESGISLAFYDGLKDFDDLEPEQQQFILQQVKQSIEMFKKMKSDKN